METLLLFALLIVLIATSIPIGIALGLATAIMLHARRAITTPCNAPALGHDESVREPDRGRGHPLVGLDAPDG